MPIWYTEPINIQSPLEIDGLIGWYNSNSAQFGENNFLIRWNDLSYLKNDLVPYYSNITRNFNFNNAVLKNESFLNLDTISSGATVFIVGDLNNTINRISYYVSLFTNIFDNNSQTDDLRINTKPGFLEIGSSSAKDGGNINHEIALLNGICFNSSNNSRPYFSAAYINNDRNNIQSLNPTSITRDSTNKFNVFIGDYSNSTTRIANGINAQIFEVLLYNKVLLESDITFINTYLANKYAINLSNNNFTY